MFYYRVKELTEQVEQSSNETRRLQEDVAFKESELEVLRDCFLQLKAFQEEDEMREDSGRFIIVIPVC